MSSSNGVITFLLGTAIGVGTGLYLNSKQGKKVRKKAASKVSDIESTIEEKVNTAFEGLKGKVNNTAHRVVDATEN